MSNSIVHFRVSTFAPMAQWLRGQASEPKDYEFEPHRCDLVRAYGLRYFQVRPKISHLKKNQKKNQLHTQICQLNTANTFILDLSALRIINYKDIII